MGDKKGTTHSIEKEIMSRRLKVALQIFILLILAGCIPAKPQIGINTPMPESMKGYELYSWNREGIWKFKLITGTNRNKSMEEITSTEMTISEDGWVNYFITGNDGLFMLLEQLPRKSFLIWNPIYNPGGNENLFIYPDEETINKAREICRKKEIEIMMPGEHP
jgi:hypothetical protein